MTETGFECTAYFRGKDGKGTCDTDCQWWQGGGCSAAKGSDAWDGKVSEDMTKIMAETQTKIIGAILATENAEKN